jgi:Uncharacterized protein conserved in bacteria (DUF2252)
MSFKADNRAYEKWLRTQCDVVEPDLDYKHKRMRQSAFVFLRATFFRWAGQIEKICPALAKAPVALSVGDVHVENFGTWRDAEGRLVWGINDFDEAADIPYPFDLVRLATSAYLVPNSPLPPQDVSHAILAGYSEGLANPRPTLLAEQDTPLRKLIADLQDDPPEFWRKVENYDRAVPPNAVADQLRRSLPHGATLLCFATHAKGGGSLGRPRYFALAEWRGGRVLREAKALVPSGWEWAHDSVAGFSRFLDLARGTFRSPDPFLDVRHRFIVRRIAADSHKLEFGKDPLVSQELLAAMGFDLGAIHAADRRRDQVHKHLQRLSGDWLHDAATAAMHAVQEDFARWSQ